MCEKRKVSRMNRELEIWRESNSIFIHSFIRTHSTRARGEYIIAIWSFHAAPTDEISSIVATMHNTCAHIKWSKKRHTEETDDEDKANDRISRAKKEEEKTMWCASSSIFLCVCVLIRNRSRSYTTHWQNYLFELCISTYTTPWTMNTWTGIT